MQSIPMSSIGSTTSAQLQRMLQTLTPTLSGIYRRWLRARRACATARALNQLDDRLLRDLGLDRSELFSVAAELYDLTERERRHAMPGTQPTPPSPTSCLGRSTPCGPRRAF